MRKSRSLVVIGAVVVAAAIVAALSVFGSDVRCLFGASTDVLGGNTQSSVSPYAGKKLLSTFGRQADGLLRGPLPLPPSGESYQRQAPNPFVTAAEDRFSTFAIDVDTASYTLARRKLQSGAWPDADGVRVEEFLNYFKYSYPAPKDRPYAVYMDAAPSPFTPGRTLLRVGLQARQVSAAERQPTHLTFLVDVSGSMSAEDRLPLARRALHLLVDNLNEGDTVGIVTYAGGVRLVLEQTSAADKRTIHEAIDTLQSGGGTAMSDGLALAYRVAAHALKPGEPSRVLVLTDGDANLGPTSQEEMQSIVAGHVAEGVTLSVVGFGVGNYKDSRLEALADKGNGNYSYVDSFQQAKRLFQDQIAGTLQVLAKDVKVQVEFDPARVKSYRLVGYENRAIADADFRKDAVDAGELGPGHSVTALYELDVRDRSGTLATVHVRAKAPTGTVAEEESFAFDGRHTASRFADAAADLRFATAVMGFGEILRGSGYASDWSFAQITDIATPLATDADRAEFLGLVRQAEQLCGSVGPCRDGRRLASVR